MGIGTKIDITVKQKKLIILLINRYLPKTTVWAFGSRVKFTSRPESDLDLVAFIKPEQKSDLSDLKETFEESDLPFRVDILDWNRIPESFKKNIAKGYVVLVDVEEKREVREGWKRYRLSEVVELIGGGTPKTTISEYWNGDVPWLSVVDFANGQKHVYKTEKTITQKGLKESSTKILKKGQIIISARGTVGELSVLGKDMAFNQSCYGITSKEKTENYFLYYLIKHSIEKIKKNTLGAVFDTITKQTFDNIEVVIPESIETQHSIASILSSLDDKIEINLQMNQTLESMAQAIFREWFVKFNFPGFDGQLVDGLPKGWGKKGIGQIITVQNGYAFKSVDLKDRGSNGIIKIKNILNKVVDIENVQFLEDKIAKKVDKKFRVNSNDLLIAMTGAQVGKIGIVPKTNNILWLNQRVGLFNEKVKYSKWFCYLILSTNEYQNILLSSASGSAQPNISSIQIEAVETIIPTNDLIEKFGEAVNILFEKITENYYQNQILTSTRDTLLPKLMSGKIEVKA
jgi:type I restriction enzyme S subunit